MLDQVFVLELVPDGEEGTCGVRTLRNIEDYDLSDAVHKKQKA